MKFMKAQKIYHVKGHYRHRIVHVRGERYIFDIDDHWWLMFFPFLYWFIPHTWHRIHGDALEVLETKSIDKVKATGSAISQGLIVAALPNISAAVINYTSLGLGPVINTIILIVTTGCVIAIRIYGTRLFKKNMDSVITWKDELQTERVIILPSSFLQVVISLFFFILIAWLTMASYYFFWIESNVFFLVIAMISFFMYLLTFVFFIPISQFRAIFLNRK